MKISELSNPLVRDAITAIRERDREAWFAVFTTDLDFTDDGETREFVTWSDDEIFVDATLEITAITREADDGHTVYTRMNSSKWGEMEGFWRFGFANGEITRLDVGQA